jgi:hypothetical protein
MFRIRAASVKRETFHRFIIVILFLIIIRRLKLKLRAYIKMAVAFGIVPKGWLRIARRFNAGRANDIFQVPSGRLNIRPSLRDLMTGED